MFVFSLFFRFIACSSFITHTTGSCYINQLYVSLLMHLNWYISLSLRLKRPLDSPPTRPHTTRLHALPFFFFFFYFFSFFFLWPVLHRITSWVTHSRSSFSRFASFPYYNVNSVLFLVFSSPYKSWVVKLKLLSYILKSWVMQLYPLWLYSLIFP